MPMSPEVFAATMSVVVNNTDTIAAHQVADAMVAQLLIDLGYIEGATTYKQLQKGYNV